MGRWDAIFFVDNPGPRSGCDILGIYVRQFMGKETSDFPKVPDLDGYSGAEIRQVAIEAAYNGGDLSAAARFVIPISRSQKDQMDRLREWATGPDHPGQQAGPGRGQGQEEGAVMMAVEISEETRQIIEVPVPISLPKWAWLIITARAKALHEGDIDACVQELLNVGIQSEIKIMGTVGPEGEKLMSHYSEVQVEFRDRAALVAALERLGSRARLKSTRKPRLFTATKVTGENSRRTSLSGGSMWAWQPTTSVSSSTRMVYTGLISPTLTGRKTAITTPGWESSSSPTG